MKFRVGVPRNQPLALPVLVDDWIPADHLARVVDRVVDALDLSEVEATFHDHGPGAPAYSPKLLLKLLAYGYLTHRFSSRRISLACREDLGFLWLARLEQPRHSVISDFRQQHVDDLPEWIAQVVLLCMEEGMVGWKLGALDGTKIHADASKHKAMSFGRMTTVIPQLEEELKKIVAAHGAADDALPADPTVAAVPADHEDRVRERMAAIRKAQPTLNRPTRRKSISPIPSRILWSPKTKESNKPTTAKSWSMRKKGSSWQPWSRSIRTIWKN